MWTIINMLLIFMLIFSFITDVKERKILNIVTLPTIIVALTYYTITGGMVGLLFSGQGFLVGLGLLFLPYALGGIGAGDVKLLAAIGALKGTVFVFYAFLFTCIAGGIIALFILMKHKEVKESIMRLWLVSKWRKLDMLHQHEYHHAFPYGVAIVIGTFVEWIWGVV